MQLLPENQLDYVGEVAEAQARAPHPVEHNNAPIQRIQSSNNSREDREGVSDVKDDSQPKIMMSDINSTFPSNTDCNDSQDPRHALPQPSLLNGAQEPLFVKKEEPEDTLANDVRFTTLFGFGVLKDSIWNMRKPLSWWLSLCMLMWIIFHMASIFRTTFAPLCIVPGISQIILCVPTTPAPNVNFDKLVNIQGSTFEQLVRESAGGSQLSIQVLRAEMATQDLSLLVRYSNLRSKDDIANMLQTIATNAKKASRGLTTLNAKVVGAIDEVMALNNYAMATIESADKKTPLRLLQAIIPVKSGSSAGEIITEAFMLATGKSEQTIWKLIEAAEVSEQNLQQLEVDIEVLHEMIIVEEEYTNVERDKLLGELWVKLGGKRKAVQDFDDRLALLNNLGEYRKQATIHVKTALLVLHMMSDDLRVLRERVAAPDLLGSKVPLHVHIESIRNGLERLQEGRRASRTSGLQGEIARKLLL